jgi:hypothetical protein
MATQTLGCNAYSNLLAVQRRRNALVRFRRKRSAHNNRNRFDNNNASPI